jgi:nucleoside-diphosphate-sugar epimerase
MNVLITGAAGFVGSVLTPHLLSKGYHVKALDLHLYGHGTLAPHPYLEEIHGDIRDTTLLKNVLQNCGAVIHLACVSNDPSFELNPALGKSINYDAFGPLVDLARDAGVRRFIYASSSSVYGVKSETRVTEDLTLQPLTDYSKYKALCEDVLNAKRAKGFETVILRPATISGYSPRFRMDVVVNTLVMQALAAKRITVLGGAQQRSNLHIADMADVYQLCLEAPTERVDGHTFNVGGENYHISDLACKIRGYLGGVIDIETLPTNDPRSYSLCSTKILRRLAYAPKRKLTKSILDLEVAYQAGKIVDPIHNPVYYNVKWLQKEGVR